jgi:hypothetical protein
MLSSLLIFYIWKFLTPPMSSCLLNGWQLLVLNRQCGTHANTRNRRVRGVVIGGKKIIKFIDKRGR